MNRATFFHFQWILILLVVVFAYEGFYTKRNPFWDDTKTLFKSISIAVLMILGIISFLKLPYDFSRMFILLFWCVAIFIFPLIRFYGKRLLYKLHIWNEPILILGTNEIAIDMAHNLEKNTYLGYEVKGFITTDPKNLQQDINTQHNTYKVLGTIYDYCSLIQKYDAQVLLVAIFGAGSEKLAKMVSKIQTCARRILVVPEVKGFAMQNTKLLHMYSSEMFLLEVNNNLKTTINRALKKLFDYTIAILLLPILLPIIATLSIFIKRDSDGPIFFIQDRLGYQGKTFRCIKFRTMYTNGDEILEKYLAENEEAREEYRVYKKLRTYDPRITKMGAFFRKTSLDEIPQIFNVLKGEMSLVGPRPYLHREIEDMGSYKEIILESEPGITGLWQVSGRNNLEFEQRVKLDVWYVLNWSVWLDVSILLKTVKVVLKREGAF